ncbi:MAG: DegV family protein [Chloroflexi bacterium]|nr:DegV family protein [Chloroflexota bacterium]
MKESQVQVTVVTDSVACLTRELIDRYAIEIVPINFLYNGRVYRDWLDITPSQAYELFLKDPESLRTSAASPEECLRAYREAARRANNIVCVTVSARLSAVFSAARDAREQLAREMPEVNIEVLDSQTATAAEGFVVLAAARAAQEGKGIAGVLEAADLVRSRVNCIVLLDTIKHVYRSGRIPKVAAQVGSILNIRPILTVAGSVRFIGAVRNRAAGLDRIIQMMREKTGDRPVHVSVMHAYAPEVAAKLMQRVGAEFNCVELWLSEFSPVMGYACGTGTVGLAFYADQ